MEQYGVFVSLKCSKKEEKKIQVIKHWWCWFKNNEILNKNTCWGLFIYLKMFEPIVFLFHVLLNWPVCEVLFTYVSIFFVKDEIPM